MSTNVTNVSETKVTNQEKADKNRGKNKNNRKVQLSKAESTIAKGNHSMIRINYLYQAALLQSGQNRALATFYGDTLLAVGKKSVSRISPGIKNTICVRCHCPLVVGRSSKVKLRSRSKTGDGKRRMDMTCEECGAKKAFLLENKKAKSVKK